MVFQISDDEDDTHPNIDTPSLFRWRHQARLERMEEQRRERERLEAIKKEHNQQLEKVKSQLAQAESAEASANLTSLKEALKNLEKEDEELRKKEEECKKKEKITPWNVDTISNPGFTKTVINKPVPRGDAELTEEEKERRMRQFVKDNEKLLKQYGMFRKYDDSKRFLQEHPHLACEDTANYLVIWCINLQMEGKGELMEHVAHQCICMQYILELAKQLDVDPRACVSSFFSKIQVAEAEYKNSFDDECDQFKTRIRRRAEEKIKEAEEEERRQRLGPGGLDPVEVFETLPPELQKCFETQDIPLLQQTIAALPEEEAVYHMKRCVDSGLWVPDARKNASSDESQTLEPGAFPEK
ncbi:hsp90 co-chaperone Cdc37 isoform X2 [Bacillus rossius redtenbacheri]|uniref:hsp90 co-chaperone Cdc37 isoform X2 n=1 Tax=Bacillus rossius redtenbacheri TaxID=93214 RepID=UPI002FDE5FF5